MFTPNPTQYSKNELTHKQIILQQLFMCNKIFSGFEATPSTINQAAGIYDFTTQAHTGKAILLAVLTLEANARPILPEPYERRVKEIKEKVFTPIQKTIDGPRGKENYTGLKCIIPDPATQLQGIIEIHEYYKELIAAIYSLPSFSDVISRHQIAPKENISEEEIAEPESVVYDATTKDPELLGE